MTANAGTAGFLVDGHRTTFRVSGANAFYEVRTTPFLFRNNGGEIVFENGAGHDLKGSDFTYTVVNKNNRLIVRSGAKVKCLNGLKTAGVAKLCVNNWIVVEDGAELTMGSSKGLNVIGNDCGLTVDDAAVSIPSHELTLCNGTGTGTNGTVRVRGSHPKLVAGWSFRLNNHSRISIDLPAGGYDAGFATKESPIISAGSSSGEMGLFTDGTSGLELTGLKAFQDYHTKANKKGEYCLIHANTGGINLQAANLAVLQAQLPRGSKLALRTVPNGQDLVLSVRPERGMVVVIR